MVNFYSTLFLLILGPQTQVAPCELPAIHEGQVKLITWLGRIEQCIQHLNKTLDEKEKELLDKWEKDRDSLEKTISTGDRTSRDYASRNEGNIEDARKEISSLRQVLDDLEARMDSITYEIAQPLVELPDGRIAFNFRRGEISIDSGENATPNVQIGLLDRDNSTLRLLSAGKNVVELISMQQTGTVKVFGPPGTATAELSADENIGGGALTIRSNLPRRLLYLGADNAGRVGTLQIDHPSIGGEFLARLSGDDAGGSLILKSEAANAGNLDLGFDKNGPPRIWINDKRIGDFAEYFEIAADEDVVPGTVISVGIDGKLRPSNRPFDHSVIGVTSGAGDLSSGFVLGAQSPSGKSALVAIAGQVYVRANLEGGDIKPGDLLVTSSSPGVAMRTKIKNAENGTVIGKSMGFLASDCIADDEALVRVLIWHR